MKAKKLKPEEKVEQVIQAASTADARFDPNGSYTGKPAERQQTPVQDADDL